MSKQKRRARKITRATVIGISSAVVVVSLFSYFATLSLIPVNTDFPVFASPTNTFLKVIESPQAGHAFAQQSTKTSKGGGGTINPTIHFTKGSLASIHLINENFHEKHNINIDEFNVHSKDLGYFNSQTITFIADKEGTFEYYCSIYPDMRGTIIVEGA